MRPRTAAPILRAPSCPQAAMTFQQQPRYRPSIIVLHWLTLVLLVAVYATMELRGLFPRGSATRELMKETHFLLGLAVFVLAWLRLALRATGATPPITPPLPLWQTVLSRVVALAMYGLMLAMPVIGYLMLNASGTAPSLGGCRLPLLVGADPALGERLAAWHGAIAMAGYGLVGLHTVAALYHHHVRQDDTLVRMSLRR